MLLGIGVMLNFEIHQMDIKSTFLHDELKEGMYMVQIESYKELDRRYFVCRHQKAIYELRQMFQVWNERIDGAKGLQTMQI
jgi:hypothetical protein